MKKIDSLMAEVEKVLRMYKRARNDDTYLTIMIWKRHGAFKGGILSSNYLYLLPKASAIERCRRKIQENARAKIEVLMYLGEATAASTREYSEVMPTDESVIEARKIAEGNWRVWAIEN